MSFWSRIVSAVEALTSGESLSTVIENLTTPPEKTIGFAIAVIGLGAKMAKADGQVSSDEVSAFREVFQIAPEDEKNVARIFNLARQDVAGFDAYARSVARMFDQDNEILIDLLEGLFHIATVDGVYHPAEEEYLSEVASIFGIPDRVFTCIRARFVEDATPDPYDLLGVNPSDPIDTIRARWRILVKENHPDKLMARGLPAEAVALATGRMTAINTAWDNIRTERGLA